MGLTQAALIHWLRGSLAPQSRVRKPGPAMSSNAEAPIFLFFVQDDYRHLKNKDKMEEEQEDKDTGMWLIPMGHRPQPCLLVLMSAPQNSLTSSSTLMTRTGWTRCLQL
jgi:hypothetical protein